MKKKNVYAANLLFFPLFLSPETISFLFGFCFVYYFMHYAFLFPPLFDYEIEWWTLGPENEASIQAE